MGRCQSTPGLVESKEKTTIEEMWISPQALPSATLSFGTQQTLVSVDPSATQQSVASSKTVVDSFDNFRTLPYSPKSQRRESAVDRTRITDSPGSISPSVQSSDERSRSRITSHISRPQSQPSRNGKKSPCYLILNPFTWRKISFSWLS